MALNNRSNKKPAPKQERVFYKPSTTVKKNPLGQIVNVLGFLIKHAATVALILEVLTFAHDKLKGITDEQPKAE